MLVKRDSTAPNEHTLDLPIGIKTLCLAAVSADTQLAHLLSMAPISPIKGAGTMTKYAGSVTDRQE